MIRIIGDLPDAVLGFNASGEVGADDYRTVLVPAIERALAAAPKVRLLYVLGPDFQGYTGAALWEDSKVGLAHLTRFDRIAVVSDVAWIVNSVKAFGFVIPCEVRVFDNAGLQAAREWICEPPVAGRLAFEFIDQSRVLVLRPHGELTAADFARVSDEIDPVIEKLGMLNGVMIVAQQFPGWEDLAAFFAHLRFVRHHHHDIRRLAIVTDDRLLSTMPRIAGQFLVSEVQHFPAAELDAALAWSSGG